MGACAGADGEVRTGAGLLLSGRQDIFCAMSTIAEVERLALDLSESDRALLVAHLLRSLPPFLYDEDEGVAEALRRAADFESDPDIGISLEQLDEQIKSRRKNR